MNIDIRIKGNIETEEYKDAIILKNIFEKEFSNKNCKGEILIISNATLFGQDVKDIDLIVVGKIDDYNCKIKSKAYSGTYKNRTELSMEERNIYIKNFCFVIETKKHIADDIVLNGLQLLVRYNQKLHDVTTQSEKQKYSLSHFFKDRLNYSPYICNFIWFRNINWHSIKMLLGNNEKILTKHNYLPDTFSVPFIFQLACTQSIPYNPIDRLSGKLKTYCYFNCIKAANTIDLNEMESIFHLFEIVRKAVGQLTRKRIEQITKKLLDEQKYAQAIGEKLIVISGRAGTGKTIKLLRIACDLAISQGARCLILTFNHALVSDIKRTLALAEIPDRIDSYSVNILTLHKFFYELLIGFGIARNLENPDEEIKFISDFIVRYDEYLNELYKYLELGLIQDKEIQDLMYSRHDKVAWDFILIDESQDWRELEKSVLYKIFGKEKIIIADGIDQLIRSQKKCNWIGGLRKEIDFKMTSEKRGLRQKVNLISFVNAYAKKIGIAWELEPKDELIGGKIIISNIGYTKALHQQEMQRCKEFGNTEYEMMFLVPPRLVNIQRTNDVEVRSFKLRSDFEDMGIKIWDSTSKDLRSEYAVNLSEHRLLQYESCRGLEGWTVVCLEFDEFIRYKFDTFSEEETEQLSLETFDEKRDRFVYLWSLIPLTRAIDTLIITINDKKSKAAENPQKYISTKSGFC